MHLDQPVDDAVLYQQLLAQLLLVDSLAAAVHTLAHICLGRGLYGRGLAGSLAHRDEASAQCAGQQVRGIRAQLGLEPVFERPGGLRGLVARGAARAEVVEVIHNLPFGLAVCGPVARQLLDLQRSIIPHVERKENVLTDTLRLAAAVAKRSALQDGDKLVPRDAAVGREPLEGAPQRLRRGHCGEKRLCAVKN
eukprot:6953099-Prymnesium_polylepis.1